MQLVNALMKKFSIKVQVAGMRALTYPCKRAENEGMHTSLLTLRRRSITGMIPVRGRVAASRVGVRRCRR